MNFFRKLFTRQRARQKSPEECRVENTTDLHLRMLEPWSYEDWNGPGSVDQWLRGIADMLDKGIPIDIRDDEGLTPFMAFFINLDEWTWGIVEREYGLPGTASPFMRIAKFLISRGADINARDNFGDTALHHAARCGSQHGAASATKLLLELGADPTIRNTSGKTPLDEADGYSRPILQKTLNRSAEPPLTPR